MAQRKDSHVASCGSSRNLELFPKLDNEETRDMVEKCDGDGEELGQPDMEAMGWWCCGGTKDRRREIVG